MPVFILCDGLKDPVAAITKMHTSGNYSHSVVMVNPGEVISQDYILRSKSIDGYRSPNYVLKCIRVNRLSKKVKQQILDAVTTDLARPWYKKVYDILGFVGQFIKVPKLNTPWLNYCSENTAKYMRLDPRVEAVLPKQVSPSDIDRVVKENPKLFKCLGYWVED
jgi:hypothetical protein